VAALAIRWDTLPAALGGVSHLIANQRITFSLDWHWKKNPPSLLLMEREDWL